MAGLRALYGRFLARPYLLLTLTAFVWAGNATASRLAVGEVSPMVLIFLRWFGVAALLAIFARPAILREAPALRRHWVFVAAMGALGFTGFNAAFYIAAHTTTAVNIGMIQGTMPMLVLAGSALAYGTRIAPAQFAGVVLGLAGAVAVVSRGDPAHVADLSFVTGDLWMLFACLCYAGYGVALRVRPPIAPIAFFAGLAAAALLSSLPLLAAEIVAGAAVWPSPKGWAIVVFVTLLPSLLSQLWFIRAVGTIGPARAGLFINLVPVFTAILGVVVLGEIFAPFHAVAMALVGGGIALAEWGRPAA